MMRHGTGDYDRKMDPETSLPFFFYGTLMEGLYNAQMLPADTEFQKAYVVGYQLYYASPRHRSYPIVRRIPAKYQLNWKDYTVQGEVAWLDVTHPAVTEVTRMELGAGYVLRPVHAQVHIPGDDAGKGVGALIFEAPEYQREFGPFISSGNWRNR